VDEFWVCAHCRSLNRAGTGKCYSCREKYGSKPKEVPGTLAKPAAAPPPLPQSRIPDFGAAQTPPPAPYYSRPVALPAAGRAAAGVVAEPRPAGQFHGPRSAIGGRIGRSLALRPTVPVGWLGYLTAICLFLALVSMALVLFTVMPVAANLLQHGHIREAWGQLNAGQQSLARFELVVAAGVGLVTLLFFSLFLGLTTHNATGLGADQPMLIPYAAGACWGGALWTQIRIAVGLIVPALLLWKGYFIPGLIAALVALELGHRHIEDPGGWISRPYRHLPDLYAKLGLEGSISSPLAWIWSGCFRLANGMAIAVSAIPLLAFILFVVAAMTGRSDLLGWQSHGLGAGQVTAALLVICLLGWTAVSVALLIPITLGLVQRQRTRKTLVRVGRARSWAARPGDNGRGKPAAAGPRDLGEFDEDRIVERVPDFAAAAPAGFDATASGMGGSIFGSGSASAGPGPSGPSGPGGQGGFGGPGASSGPGFGSPGASSGPGATSGPGFGGPGAPVNPSGFGARGGIGSLAGNPGSIGGPALARPPAGQFDAEPDDRLIDRPGFGAPRSPGFGGPGSGDPIG
jgi:uncharacterized membrane protein YgcG